MDDRLRPRFEAKYDLWKKRLLDIGAGNRLINFRQTKVSTIRITSPSIGRLYSRLVDDDASLKFPLYEGIEPVSLADDGQAGPAGPEFKVRPGDIETAKSPPELERSLARLAELGRSSKEERGVNTLYVALGMLEWRPQGKDGLGPSRAPLLLVPVELGREDRLSPYVLSPFDEDTEVNPTLTYMLEQDFGLVLPKLDDEMQSIEDFFQTIELAVRGQQWAVLREAWIGQFHFKKLAMYRDLEEHRDLAAENTTVVGIAGCGEFGDPPEIGAPSTFDDIRPSEVFTALDADSSQLEVLLRARGGQDLIVEGPPGTGKSQTITNLIAQSLLDRKRVLFVSEKMAALSVVYKRLEQIGLGSLCLEIHSDKANKRDVLKRIWEASQQAAPGLSTRARADFDRLLSLRQELNHYVRALHEPVLYEQSAFELHGELARLADVPDVPANVSIDINAMDESRREQLLRTVRRLAQMPHMLIGYFEHPWFGCTIAAWSLQTQSELLSHLSYFVQQLTDAQNTSHELASVARIDPLASVDDFERLVEVAKLFSTTPYPPRSWLDDTSLDELLERATDLARRQKQHHELVQALSLHYTADIFGLDCAGVDTALNSGVRRLLELLLKEHEKRNALADTRSTLADAARNGARALGELISTGARLSDLIHTDPAKHLDDSREFVALVALASTDPRPTRAWFEPPQLSAILREAREAKAKHERQLELRTRISAEFDGEFLALPLSEWKLTFRDEHAGMLRFLHAEYRRAMKRMRTARRTHQKLTYQIALDWIDSGAEAQQIGAWFDDAAARHAETLGLHARGEDTDWNETIESLEQVQALLQHTRGRPLPDGLIEAMLQGPPLLGDIAQLGEDARDLIEEVDTQLTVLNEHINGRALTGGTKRAEPSIVEMQEALERTAAAIDAFDAALVDMHTCLRPGSIRDAEAMSSDIQQARMVLHLERSMEAERDSLTQMYGHFFDGMRTNWDSVLSALAWTREFREVAFRYDLSDESKDAVVQSDIASKTSPLLLALRDTAAAIRDERAFLASVFDLGVIGTPATVDTCSIDLLIAWLKLRIERIGELSEWVGFNAILRECRASGLSDFVDHVLNKRIGAQHLEQTLQKRLYTLQLDAVYSEKTVLRDFQWRDHEDLIERFKQLDRELMAAFARLVRATVGEHQPDLNGPAAGQKGFLRRELVKKRRHAPLRRLFAECGDVIVGLTPCLLMSPLSAATFLRKEAVEFDLVIFDEASQMPAEEAIGAVLRGKQLIVAGDSQQLPPTRFFERSIDGTTNEDDEDDGIEVLESVLDDCRASGMQPSPLSWHYRSKHESLISFSNAEFYENRLITFPPPVNPAPEGTGVRLERVADGVYDRGRSRTNRREAERVAELIERHYDRPGRRRSLGIIALSTAQEQAIREEIDRLLIRRPDLEELLKDEDEPYFVKPLENVQGDERDTIIISIGYAKDASGNLSFNFGPINRDGGERRLNVAVTRARWELVVVSSMHSSDIDESRTDARGSKVLKRYLQFAEDGKLPPEIAAPLEETESPFEQAVYDALREQGLGVDRQVGVSKYRIDLAVRDTRRPGRYLLGIECDGAMYHSSVVARDRDRLRQQQLESLGWKIHRIWSTDWIRDRNGALQRTLDRIEELQRQSNSSDDDEPHAEPVRTARKPDPPPPVELGPVELSFDDDPYVNVVGEYRETPPSRRRRSREEFYDSDTSDIRQEIARVVAHEGPVHEQTVVQRVARAFNLLRVGANIDQAVRTEIEAVVRAGDAERRGAWLWQPGVLTVPPRRPAPGVDIRPIEEVPPEELLAAVVIVVQTSGGIVEAELIPEAARALGYARTGSHIDEAIRSALSHAVHERTVVKRGEFLTINPGNNGHEAIGAEAERISASPSSDNGPGKKSVPIRNDDLPSRVVQASEAQRSLFQTATDIDAAVREIAERKRLKVIDKRPVGGSLWLVGDRELAKELRPLGFKFAERGSRATGKRPAWYLQC